MLTFSNYSINPSFFGSVLVDDIIEPTYHTPFVRYNSRSNALTIKGSSTRDGIGNFYENVLGEFKLNLNIKKSGELNLKFHTFNVATTKVLFDLFRFLSIQKTHGAKVKVTWDVSWSQPGMEKTAEEFSSLFDLDISIV